ncbi:MAG: hypothetical protein GX804_05190 [Lentisphaerae bacterium]|jgi:hypothetical protein|nr:hypothetical protein [Lentisphaerota bacterium]
MAVIKGRVVKGHQVASGQGGDPRYPQGTIALQVPKFFELGLDLLGLHRGTINVLIAPLDFKVINPVFAFNEVRWSDDQPAENFSFCDARISLDGEKWYKGYVYYPHPETKPEHFQRPGVIELIMPLIEGLGYDSEIFLDVPEDQVVFFK